MHLGQCGVAKSGNYLVYQVQRDILEQLGLFQSFVETHGIWEPLIRLNDFPFSFPEMAVLDHVHVQEDGVVYLFNGHLKAQIGIFALDAFRTEARLVWIHQKPLEAHHALLGSERRWIYVLRDGRDVVNSWMHYVVSPRMRARNPQFSVADVTELYTNLPYFEKHVRHWVQHVRAYQALRDRYLEVRFEDLVENKAAEVKRVIGALGLEGRVEADRIVERTAVEATRQRAPQHVRAARAGTWREHFRTPHVEIFRRVSEELLEELGYSDGSDWVAAARAASHEVHSAIDVEGLAGDVSAGFAG